MAEEQNNNQQPNDNQNAAAQSAEQATSPENLENVSKDERIGIHKGALSTLAKERQELARLISIVEQLMQMHLKELKDLGIDLTQGQEGGAAPAQQGTEAVTKKSNKPIEDIL